MISLGLDTLLLGIAPAQEMKLFPPLRDIDSAYAQQALRYADDALSMDIRLPLFSEGREARRQVRREVTKAVALGLCLRERAEYATCLADALWAICMEDDWHAISGEGAIDTAAAQTGALIATCCSLHKGALDAISPDIIKRCRAEIRRRVLRPVAQYTRLNWLSDDGVEPACCALLECAVLQGEEGGERWLVVKKALRLLEAYLNTKKEAHFFSIRDFMERAGALCDTFSLLKLISGGKIDLTRDNALQRDVLLPLAAYIGNGWFVDPGAGNMRFEPDTRMLFHIGLGMQQKRLTGMAAYFALASRPMQSTLYQRRCFLAESGEYAREPVALSLFPEICMEKQGYMAMRSETLFCAVHAGSGFHADAGDIALFYRGEPVLIDIGEVSRAEWHNVPVVCGIQQIPGVLASDLDFRGERGYTALSLSLTRAYDARARLSSWQRTLMLMGSAVRLIDMFELGSAGRVDFRFITPIAPKRTDNGIQLGAIFLSWEGMPLTCRIDSIEPQSDTFGDRVYRITLSMQEDVRGGSVAFTFEDMGRETQDDAVYRDTVLQ
ncbi:MAG: hypothetical protein ACOYI8_11285 [Christensenellales bacterium]